MTLAVQYECYYYTQFRRACLSSQVFCFSTTMVAQAKNQNNRENHQRAGLCYSQRVRGTIGSMQNTVRWRSNRLDDAVVGCYLLGNPWSNESDANLEDSYCISLHIMNVVIFLNLKIK